MSEYEVPEPILNSPFLEPKSYWDIQSGQTPVKKDGRRSAGYFFRDPRAGSSDSEHDARGQWQELPVVNLIRGRLADWQKAGFPGVTRTTLELLSYWQREGRQHRLFFAQLEAVQTIIFLTEARPDFLQGITVPLDEPSDDQKMQGAAAFRRVACKMATGSGKTTVMGMLAAWSILNKVNNRSDSRFSDVVLVVCPNVTIRGRLQELVPDGGEASLYRTRDLVPSHLMPDLTKGRVLTTNWHVFEPQAIQTGGVGARVSKAGQEIRVRQKITIGPKTTTARNRRYLTMDELNRQLNAGLITVLSEEKDREGNTKSVYVESRDYVESDTSLVSRVLGREVGGKQNILVFNDEAHHAYRIRQAEPDEDDDETEDDVSDEFFKEATVWVEGLDRINKLRGVNFCVDLSATPYFLGRVGQDTNRIFPWTVSDFGLTDAIESGLVKIPQLAIRDTTGAEIPGYFNIWRWIQGKLTSAERGGSRGTPKPEAVVKWAHQPIVMLAGFWEELRREWESSADDPRPPVFIIVCKNTKIAKNIFEWLAEDKSPTGVPSARIDGFLNKNGRINTIRVDSKVVEETDSDTAKSDESRWMRLTLDTVGKKDWPKDRQGRSLYPEGFEDLAKKLNRILSPPGKDIRCIVSVGMLTEGWDCNTVTHIVGLRPFMSQLLCEQVVGRGLRRRSYELGPDDKLTEEVAKVFGVPFEIIPFKQNKGSATPPSPKRHHVCSLSEKSSYEIKFPRVEGYRQAIRSRVKVNWQDVPVLVLDPTKIPPEVEVKAFLTTNEGRPSLMGPGKIQELNLNPYRAERRFQELVFEISRDLTRGYLAQPNCGVPAQVLFPQLVKIVERYMREKVHPIPPADIRDVGLSPYYGLAVESLSQSIVPDTDSGEEPELPIYETSRGAGTTADVDFWTGRDVREAIRSHVNYVVADTDKWEQSAAYIIDTHPNVRAFVKNAGLGFAIPYVFNGQSHDYEPDFIIRLKSEKLLNLILEVKGFDERAEVKAQAAQRWVSAVNADGTYGEWRYVVARKIEDVRNEINRAIPVTLSSKV